MPPKAKITKDMITDAALEVASQEGEGSINARSVAERLHCSTQPVMYHFSTIRELKNAAYAKLDRMHTAYLLNVSPTQDPLLGIGLNYIRFAVEKPNLFRFLLQSGYAAEKNLAQMLDSEALTPVLSAMQSGLNMSAEKTKDVFLTVALFTHGYASILANNGLEFDEKTVARHLERAFAGAVLAMQEEKEP